MGCCRGLGTLRSRTGRGSSHGAPCGRPTSVAQCGRLALARHLRSPNRTPLGPPAVRRSTTAQA
eukprot:9863454-Lingulodinium_polyedra.AAC.1